MSDNGQRYATRVDLLRPIERRYRVVDVDGLGLVRIQNLSERESADYSVQSVNRKTGRLDPGKAAEARRRLIALCVVDEEGNRLFGPGDLHALGQIDGRIADQLYAACEEHNETGSLETREKNSRAIPD